MRFSRDLVLFLFLFALLIGLAVVSSVQRAQSDRENRQAQIPYSTHSADANGTLALHNWLQAAGFRARRIENQAFGIDSDVRVLVLFEPRVTLDDEHTRAITQWVERGNTLVVAEEFSARSDRLHRALNIKLNFLDRSARQAALEQPLQGKLRGEKIQVDTRMALVVDRNDAVAYLSAEGKPLLVAFPQGKGRVWWTSSPDLFNNENLERETNAALVMAMFGGVPRGSVIAFDEYHLGLTALVNAGSHSVQEWLYTTRGGWAILYALLLGLVYLFLNGRRFGRAVPLPKDIERRNPAEYVTSMANLYRRAGKRGLAARHYRRRLKRVLGKLYLINPDLPDVAFVDELARYREDVNREELLQLLRTLEREKTDERTLVKLANQTIRYTTR